MNLTAASSSDLPSEALLTRVSESGARLTQTAIFMWEFSVVSHQSSVQSQDAKAQADHSLQCEGKQTRQLSSGNRLRRSVWELRSGPTADDCQLQKSSLAQADPARR